MLNYSDSCVGMNELLVQKYPGLPEMPSQSY